MLPNIKALAYDSEEKHLLVEYQGKQYYFEMDGFMHAARSNRRKYDLSVEKGETSKRNNKLRNLNFYERIMVMTGLPITELQEEFNYKVMNEDYWFDTIRTSSEIGSEPVQNRIIPIRTGSNRPVGRFRAIAIKYNRVGGIAHCQTKQV